MKDILIISKGILYLIMLYQYIHEIILVYQSELITSTKVVVITSLIYFVVSAATLILGKK